MERFKIQSVILIKPTKILSYLLWHNLINLVHQSLLFLFSKDPSLRLNTTYYLTRQLVPSLNRVFGLLGVDTMQWYQELPRWQRVTSHHQLGTPGKKVNTFFIFNRHLLKHRLANRKKTKHVKRPKFRLIFFIDWLI